MPKPDCTGGALSRLWRQLLLNGESVNDIAIAGDEWE